MHRFCKSKQYASGTPAQFLFSQDGGYRIVHHSGIGYRLVQHSGILLEVGVGPVGLDQGPGLLLDSARERELDLGVVGLGEQGPATLAGSNSLTPDDLDGVSSGPVPGSHVPEIRR